MSNEPEAADLLALIPFHRGHFRFESGHHGDLWLGLDALFLKPGAIRPYAAGLARLLAASKPQVICGPLLGGTLVAQMVAEELRVEFCYSGPGQIPAHGGLYTANYEIAAGLKENLQRKRVAVVDDVINAGSAARATMASLEACDAVPCALGALLVLGTAALSLAATRQIPLETIASLPNELFDPLDCPLCSAGIPLEIP